jgi:uncharacterized protein YkwD
VVVDALADLGPLPTAARAGEWLTIDAELLVPAGQAKVVVLGPRSAPRMVPTTKRGSRVHARFAPDRPGAFLVQVLAAVTTGPRPVIEAMVFASEEPPTSFASARVPGEAAADPFLDPRATLYAILAEARTLERRPPLARSPELEALAQAHAEAMHRAGRLGHDIGRGTVDQRAGLDPRRVGENVARAPTAVRAHRVLWASPSHRANILDPRFDNVGIGVSRTAGGAVWVCQIFADFHSTGVVVRH